MVEREEIMVVRKVYQANSLPTIGAMFPQIKDDENVCIIIMWDLYITCLTWIIF